MNTPDSDEAYREFADAAVKRIHPEARIEDLHLEPMVANPLTGVATCAVCYHEVTAVPRRTWYGRRYLTLVRTHKHFTATISNTRPWEYAGTDEMPPFAVYEALQERFRKICKEQVRWLAENPSFLSQGLAVNLQRLDGLSRELVYEAILDSQYGEELAAFVRRADRVKLSEN